MESKTIPVRESDWVRACAKGNRRSSKLDRNFIFMVKGVSFTLLDHAGPLFFPAGMKISEKNHCCTYFRMPILTATNQLHS